MKVTDVQVMYFEELLAQADAKRVKNYNTPEMSHYWKADENDHYNKWNDLSDIKNREVFGFRVLVDEKSGGNCWGGQAENSHVEAFHNIRDTFFVDRLLKQHFAEMSLGQYVSIINNFEECDFTDGGYYGNTKQYKILEVNVKELLQKMQDFGLDVSERVLEAMVEYYKPDVDSKRKCKM